jgi:hypothetical protein
MGPGSLTVGYVDSDAGSHNGWATLDNYHAPPGTVAAQIWPMTEGPDAGWRITDFDLSSW